jgi:hypothetical protein
MSSRIEWQWQDAGSGPGHMQRVIVHDNPEPAVETPAAEVEQSPWAKFLKHCHGCPDCGFGKTRCPLAEELWWAYLDARPALGAGIKPPP